jgi:pimeloyl-ACP methyl ester carboxylesterase
MTDLRFLDRGGGDRLAYRRTAGGAPGVFWTGGFRSDMEGTKASLVAGWAERQGRASLRFDYFGHGSSTGDFAAGTITRWRDDALAAFDALTEGPQILVGSSMGGWIALLLARARRERVAGLLLLAPAPDFTETLMWKPMSEDARREILEKGEWLYKAGDDSYPITRALIDSGRENLVLGETLRFAFPVRILQGMADRDVPWRHALELTECIEGDVRLTLLKNSEHRLSSPGDLKLLERTLDALVAEAGA